MATWVIIGCGYVGGSLARRLVAEGHEVIATRRPGSPPFADLPASGAWKSAGVDLGDRATLVGVIPPSSVVVCCAPPGADPAAEITALVDAARAARCLVYLSSTAVYPPAKGEWVDESWPVDPRTRAGRARQLAEGALSKASIRTMSIGPMSIGPMSIGPMSLRTVSLRVAGIHGPGRGLVDRIRAGTYRIVGDERSHVSRIHVDDLVEAIVRAAAWETTGVVNIADDDPAPIGLVADAVAASLGLPPPPRVPASAVDPEVAGMLTADRRIANHVMKAELGVVLRYPSWQTVIDAG